MVETRAYPTFFPAMHPVLRRTGVCGHPPMNGSVAPFDWLSWRSQSPRSPRTLRCPASSCRGWARELPMWIPARALPQYSSLVRRGDGLQRSLRRKLGRNRDLKSGQFDGRSPRSISRHCRGRARHPKQHRRTSTPENTKRLRWSQPVHQLSMQYREGRLCF